MQSIHLYHMTAIIKESNLQIYRSKFEVRKVRALTLPAGENSQTHQILWTATNSMPILVGKKYRKEAYPSMQIAIKTLQFANNQKSVAQTHTLDWVSPED